MVIFNRWVSLLTFYPWVCLRGRSVTPGGAVLPWRGQEVIQTQQHTQTVWFCCHLAFTEKWSHHTSPSVPGSSGRPQQPEHVSWAVAVWLMFANSSVIFQRMGRYNLFTHYCKYSWICLLILTFFCHLTQHNIQVFLHISGFYMYFIL